MKARFTFPYNISDTASHEPGRIGEYLAAWAAAG